jgi:hypothetical protein
LLLLWGAHLNILRITSFYWSFYLLKYAIKCEPHGTLNLNTKNVECLGLQNASNIQLELISSFIISKPISPTKATFICLDIQITHKSQTMKCIDSKPLLLHTKLITKSRILGFHPIDVYIFRPTQFEN